MSAALTMNALTAEQVAAATTTSANAHVVAGPGTGKTQVIAARVAWLVSVRAVAPERILCLTFTRSAADNLRRRIEALAPSAAGRVDVLTWHGFAYRMYVEDCEREGLKPLDVAPSYVDERARRSLYTGPMARPPRGRLPRTSLDAGIVEYEASGLQNPGAELVVGRLESAGLIPLWCLVPRALDRRAGPARFYNHVLVDEAQDATRAELALVEDLCRDGASVFCVGDPMQSINGWRLGGVWAVPASGTALALTGSFRLRGKILGLANALLRLAGKPGDLTQKTTEFGTGTVIIETPDETRARIAADPSKRTAILSRSNMTAQAQEIDLGPGVAYVHRDPDDPFESDADAIAAKWDIGAIPSTTVHAFKGREASRVVLASDPAFPSDRDEELRILYVAATRAIDTLVVSRLEAGILEKVGGFAS